MLMAADSWPRGRGLAGLAVLGLAVWCGLPVLASVGAGVTVAGVGLRTWLLGGAGLRDRLGWRVALTPPRRLRVPRPHQGVLS